jgi:hypothetical protein
MVSIPRAVSIARVLKWIDTTCQSGWYPVRIKGSATSIAAAAGAKRELEQE